MAGIITLGPGVGRCRGRGPGGSDQSPVDHIETPTSRCGASAANLVKPSADALTNVIIHGLGGRGRRAGVWRLSGLGKFSRRGSARGRDSHMAGLPKAYFKRYPGNLKRAWAAYRSEHGGGKKTRAKRLKRHHAAKKSGKPARKHGGVKMATKKRKGTRRAAVKHGVRRARRRVGVALASRPAQILMGAGVATAGALGTSFAINNIPKVMDYKPGTKSAIQVGIGLAAIFFVRHKAVKALGAGAVVAGVMGV